jgi:hypothetical protein
MSNYFTIDGYWKNDNSEFYGYIVSYFDSAPENQDDDQIFFYGLSEKDIQEAIKEGEDNMLEFVITSYEPIK